MAVYLSDSSGMPYGFTYMKKKIKDHYGDDIIIAEINGKSNVVTFTTTASKILHDFHQQTEKDDSMKEKRLINAAAKLIKSDIKSIVQSKHNYPTPEEKTAEKAVEFLPESLRTLLQVLFPEKNSSVKVASLGQAITQATRPRVVFMSFTARTRCATSSSFFLKIFDRLFK